MSELYPQRFDARRILPILPGWLPEHAVQMLKVVPIGLEDDCLVMAVLESCTDKILDLVRFMCNKEIKVVVVTQEAMEYAVHRYVLKT